MASIKVYVNAGHHNNDKGASFSGHDEATIVKRIRDEIKKHRPNWHYIPDELDLKASILRVNGLSRDNDNLAIDIHLNSNQNEAIRGVEAYFDTDPHLASIFAEESAKYLKIPNRGSRHDSETSVGSLGWLRKTTCRAVLIEVCYLSNLYDRRVIMSTEGIRQAAYGIMSAVDRIEADRGNKLKAFEVILREANRKLVELFAILRGLKTKK